ncbi:MAG TPA: zinc-finger domain-containing protein [Geminicoccaceae bacterium]|nr:zinc-finger domain-containing protein [Geminicoccaceae bacterium]
MTAAQDEVPRVRDVVHVDSSSVACDGDGGALGHPRVFLALDPATGEIDCPYCSRRFIHRPEGEAPAATETARPTVEAAAS